MKKNFFFLLALIVVVAGVKVSLHYQFNPYHWYLVQNYKQEIKCPAYFVSTHGIGDPKALIAHGGGVGDFVYTNSVQAVRDSINKGFLFIELDLLKTSDGYLVGGHDWVSLKKMAHFEPADDKALTLAEVKKMKIHGQWDSVAGEDIRDLMKQYPNWVLVTDKITDFDLLLKEIPFPDRVVAEVFSVKDYVRAIESGVKFPLFSAKNVSYAKIAQLYRFPMVAVNIRRMFETAERSAMLGEFVKNNIGVWGYYTTFNKKDDNEFLKQNLGSTLTKIYTDSLSPKEFKN